MENRKLEIIAKEINETIIYIFLKQFQKLLYLLHKSKGCTEKEMIKDLAKKIFLKSRKVKSVKKQEKNKTNNIFL